MKSSKRHLILLMILSGCVFLYGCSAIEDMADNISNMDGSDYEYYSVYYYHGSNEPWIMDREGNTIAKNEVKWPIKDMETKEVLCYYTTEEEAVFPDGKMEDAYRKILNTLYDTQGNILREAAEERYWQGAGEYIVIHSDSGETYLFNYKTGEIVRDDIGYILPLGSGKYLLSDKNNSPYILADENFNELRRFQSEDRYYGWSRELKDGYFISYYTLEEVDDWQLQWGTLFDSDLNPVFDFKDADRSRAEDGIIGNYLVYRADEDNPDTKISDYEGNLIYEIDGERVSVNYFDGELLVTNHRAEDSYDNVYTMTNIKTGEVLIEDSLLITNINVSADDVPASRFIVSQKDSIAVIDREGSVKEESPLKNIKSIDVLNEQLFLLRTEDENYNPKEYLVDNQFDFIIDPDKYLNISYSRDYNKPGYPYIKYLECEYRDNLIDICDFEGNVIIENISRIYDMKDDRVTLRKGYDHGLMDNKGNWLAKESIFPSMAD